MTDKCECQFCKDSARLRIVEPLIPEEHRQWFVGMCEAFWHVDEEYGYKKAILDGSSPDSVEILERALHRAKAKRANVNEQGTCAKCGCAYLSNNHAINCLQKQ